MNILNTIINSMNKEEIRFFKIYATRMIGHKGRKDLLLFDTIRKTGVSFNETEAALKIYGAKGGAYYRLKHRLSDDLNDYMVLHHFGKGEMNALNRSWALYNIYVARKKYEVAIHFLKRGEKEAIGLENFEMLDLIYNGFIRISSELLEINPEIYIQRKKENAVRLNLLHEMDQAVAVLTFRLRLTQNFTRKGLTITPLLDKTLKEFADDIQFKNSRGFQTRIYRAVSQVLLQRHQYPELSEYLIKTYRYFDEKKWFDKDNHDIKLQMLTYISNSLYRTEKYIHSLEYAQILGKEITGFDRLLYDKFLFFYYNVLVLNYMKTDPAKVLPIIDKMESEMKQRKISYYDQFIYVNKAIVYHWLGKPDAAIRNLVKLYVLDSFKKADAAFRLKIIVAELIMQFDAGEPDTFMHRLRDAKREFKKLLLSNEFADEKKLMNFMEKMIDSKNIKADKKFANKVMGFVTEPHEKVDDELALINYRSWLNGKMA